MRKLGYIGLGKMGINQALRLKRHGFAAVCFNRGINGRSKAKKEGLQVVGTLEQLVSSLPAPRTIWLMVSHAGVDSVLADLTKLLSRGDLIIDGGNSYFKDTKRRANELKKKGIRFLDVGVSGGPDGALRGACLMVGGEKKDFKEVEELLHILSAPKALLYVGGHGAGHFVKMVHNGIEYGMMQAIAEGFSVMKKSPYKLPLKNISHLYNHKSVIESRLVGWLESAFEKFGENLDTISGSVAHTGEGQWTVKTARELGVPAPVIKASFAFRVGSSKHPSYSGKVLSALRNQFGGHSIKKDGNTHKSK